MTQLIVRPIDDDRYSKISQAQYIHSLKDYNYNLYKIESAKFVISHYSTGLAKAARAFGEFCTAFDETINKAAKSLGEQVRRGIDEARKKDG